MDCIIPTIIPLQLDSKTMQEWIEHCISKHGPHGDKTMKPVQCVAAGHSKFGKSKDFSNTDDFIDAAISFVMTTDAVEPKELKEIKELIRGLTEGETPRLTDRTTGTSITGKLSFKNRPMTPVSSSMIAGRSVSGTNLYVRFHKRPNKTYKLKMNNNEDALKAYDDMTKGSPGRWYWENVRGHKKGTKVTEGKLGPVYGKPSKTTIGGTSASKIPYEPISTARLKPHITEVPKFEKISKALQAFKMSVKEPSTSGDPFTTKELKKAQKLGIFPPKVDFSTDAEEKQVAYKGRMGVWKTTEKGRKIFIPEGHEIIFSEGGKTFKIKKIAPELSEAAKKVKLPQRELTGAEVAKKVKLIGAGKKEIKPYQAVGRLRRAKKAEVISERIRIEKEAERIKKGEVKGQLHKKYTNKYNKLNNERVKTEERLNNLLFESAYPSKDALGRVVDKLDEQYSEMKKIEMIMAFPSKIGKEKKLKRLVKRLEKWLFSLKKTRDTLALKQAIVRSKLPPKPGTTIVKRIKVPLSKIQSSIKTIMNQTLPNIEAEIQLRRNTVASKASRTAKKQAQIRLEFLIEKQTNVQKELKALNEQLAQKEKTEIVERKTRRVTSSSELRKTKKKIEKIKNRIQLLNDIFSNVAAKGTGIKEVRTKLKITKIKGESKIKKLAAAERKRKKHELIGSLVKKDFEDYTYDFIDISQFSNENVNNNLNTFKEDFSVLHGPVVRDGAYEYFKNGKMVTLYKDYDQFKPIYNELKYVPLRGSKEVGSHQANIIGFMTNFQPDDITRKVYADLVTFDDISNLSDLYDPEGGWQVSMGFEDDIIGNVQHIRRVDHGSISLNNKEIGRCATAGGEACAVKRKN